MDARTRELFEVNIDDILAAFGWENAPVLRPLVRRVARRPALAFAREMTGFDERAAAAGAQAASRELLSSFTRGVTVTGAERIPPRGPVLLLSNHPGMTDTLALFSAIPRDDLRVLAAERPFLRALPAVVQRLIFIPEDGSKRLGAVRRAIDHLRAGGALLTFPAGEIEPDPAVLTGATAGLDRWSESTSVFLRLAPECTVVPVIVSGVLAPQAQRHPLTRLRRRRVDRERLGAMLQVLAHTLRPEAWRVRVRVDFPAAFTARELSGRGPASRAPLMQTVAETLRLRERA